MVVEKKEAWFEVKDGGSFFIIAAIS